MRLLNFLFYGQASGFFGWCAYLAATGRLDDVPIFILVIGLALTSLRMLIGALEAGFPDLKEPT